MSVAEISRAMGVDESWVEALISAWGEGTLAEEKHA
jgi:hypothetical protein